MKKMKQSRWTLVAVLIWLTSASLAQAFYNPNSGRWLNRDPIGETSDKSLYAFVNNSPISAYHKDGRVTITRTEPSVERQCEEVKLKWWYSTDNKPCDEGYLVQEISFYMDRSESCCSPLIQPPPKTLLFHIWEAFPVGKDKDTYESPHDGSGFTDGFRYTAFPQSSGAILSVFNVRFFCKDGKTGDLESDPNWRTGPGKYFNTGGLPWTPDKPSWWDNADDPPATREVAIDWVCCPFLLQTWNLSASP